MAKSSRIILPSENIVEVQQAQRELTDLLSELDRAEECGVDCQAFRAAAQEALQQGENIIKNYGPGLPKRR